MSVYEKLEFWWERTDGPPTWLGCLKVYILRDTTGSVHPNSSITKVFPYEWNEVPAFVCTGVVHLFVECIPRLSSVFVVVTTLPFHNLKLLVLQRTLFHFILDPFETFVFSRPSQTNHIPVPPNHTHVLFYPIDCSFLEHNSFWEWNHDDFKKFDCLTKESWWWVVVVVVSPVRTTTRLALVAVLAPKFRCVLVDWKQTCRFRHVSISSSDWFYPFVFRCCWWWCHCEILLAFRIGGRILLVLVGSYK